MTVLAMGINWMRNLLPSLPGKVALPSPFTVTGPLDNFFYTISSGILHINGCPQLIPLLASWMFIAGVALWCFPSLVYHLQAPRVWRHLNLACRLMAPLMMFRVLWAPYNRILLLLLRDVFVISPCSLNVLLPLLSLASAGGLLYSAWGHATGWTTNQKTPQKSITSRRDVRRLRSGKVFGRW